LYLVAVLQTLTSYKPPFFRISVDGSTTVGKRLLVAVGNGRCAGGGFYLTPEASVDDGKLDVCSIQDVPVAKILRLIPAVMRGKRVEDMAVSYSRIAGIEVESAERFNVHADGEVVGRQVLGVKLEVAAGVLNIIGPRG